eukprot:scaffold123980_cov69-Phaeocystis_antarctica.AAC.1
MPLIPGVHGGMAAAVAASGVPGGLLRLTQVLAEHLSQQRLVHVGEGHVALHQRQRVGVLRGGLVVGALLDEHVAEQLVRGRRRVHHERAPRACLGDGPRTELCKLAADLGEQRGVGQLELERVVQRLLRFGQPLLLHAEQRELPPRGRLAVVEYVRLGEALLGLGPVLEAEARRARAEPRGARGREAARLQEDVLGACPLALVELEPAEQQQHLRWRLRRVLERRFVRRDGTSLVIALQQQRVAQPLVRERAGRRGGERRARRGRRLGGLLRLQQQLRAAEQHPAVLRVGAVLVDLELQRLLDERPRVERQQRLGQREVGLVHAAPHLLRHGDAGLVRRLGVALAPHKLVQRRHEQPGVERAGGRVERALEEDLRALEVPARGEHAAVRRERRGVDAVESHRLARALLSLGRVARAHEEGAVVEPRGELVPGRDDALLVQARRRGQAESELHLVG